jgi:hypothetical protein
MSALKITIKLMDEVKDTGNPGFLELPEYLEMAKESGVY